MSQHQKYKYFLSLVFANHLRLNCGDVVCVNTQFTKTTSICISCIKKFELKKHESKIIIPNFLKEMFLIRKYHMTRFCAKKKNNNTMPRQTIQYHFNVQVNLK